MSDENDDAKTHPGIDVEKYTWHKDDVEWLPVNPEAPLLISLEDRREIWNKLNPGVPLPPRLREGTHFYPTAAELQAQGKTTDKRAEKRTGKRPQVRVHIHKGR